MADKCTCIPCLECNGSGHVWYSFSGQYLGKGRCDDLDIMEPCDECRGSGVKETCDDCRERMESERDN